MTLLLGKSLYSLGILLVCLYVVNHITLIVHLNMTQSSESVKVVDTANRSSVDSMLFSDFNKEMQTPIISFSAEAFAGLKIPGTLDELEASGTLPFWLMEYLKWHSTVRKKFPDRALLDDPEAPGIIIKYCWRRCGGLFDRLSGLPEILYTAHRMRRVLLFKWALPVPLETFMVPNIINWTVPAYDKLMNPKDIVQNDLLNGYFAANQDKQFRNALDRAARSLSSNKTLVLTYWGGVGINLTEELRLDGEEADCFQDSQAFGMLWHALFRPTEPIVEILNQTVHALGLEPNTYSAVHCRVRHPGRYPADQNPDGVKPGTSADTTGLPFHGINKVRAVSTALHAIRCAKQFELSANIPIYFFADSEDLVQYIAPDRQTRPRIQTKSNSMTSLLDNRTTAAMQQALDLEWSILKNQSNVVSRDVTSWPAVHLDRQQRVPKRYFYSTFVDLYLAIGARCLTFGVGNFAYLAQKISNTKCVQLHEEFFDSRFNPQTGHLPVCTFK